MKIAAATAENRAILVHSGAHPTHGSSELLNAEEILSLMQIRGRHVWRVSSNMFPKDPAVLKILRIVNLLRVEFLVRRGDLLSRRSLCGHDFLGITDIFPLQEGSTA